MNINRDSFLEFDTNTDDLDLLTNQLFRTYFPENEAKFIVNAQDVGRPDLMAQRVLGTQELWWVLLKYNDIDDPWNELYPGQVLKIPSVTSVQSYAMDYEVR